MNDTSEHTEKEECCMTSPVRNNVFVIDPKKDVIKPVSVKSLLNELTEVRQHKTKKND